MNFLLQLLPRTTRVYRRVRGEQRGATGTEYSILTGFIAIVIVAGVGLFGVTLNSFFGFLTTGLRTALGIP